MNKYINGMNDYKCRNIKMNFEEGETREWQLSMQKNEKINVKRIMKVQNQFISSIFISYRLNNLEYIDNSMWLYII